MEGGVLKWPLGFEWGVGQKTTSVHKGGGGVKKSKILTTWFKDGPLFGIMFAE